MSNLTTEQTIRLEVLRHLPPGLSATQKAADIKTLSEAIIGGGDVSVKLAAGEVLYEGNILRVPEWATYIAADRGGDVYAFTHKPVLKNGYYWNEPGDDSEFMFLKGIGCAEAGPLKKLK